MARDLKEAAIVLEGHGLDLVKLLRDTHTETMMKVGVLLVDLLEIALRTKTREDGEEVSGRAFQHKGKWDTLAKRINGANNLGLFTETAYQDANLLRYIRNKFSHVKGLHFDSATIVSLAQGLSTYEAAETNQAAILEAMSKVTDELQTGVRARMDALRQAK